MKQLFRKHWIALTMLLVMLVGGFTIGGNYAQISVGTVAELELISGDQYIQNDARVRGFYEAGDGGGGPDRIWAYGQSPGYYLALEDGVTVIVPDGTDGSAAWVLITDLPMNAIWFGVKNGFFIDSGPQLQAWADSLDNVNRVGIIPEGTYGTNQSIRFPEIFGLDVGGAGKEATLITPLSSFPTNEAVLDFSSSVRTNTIQYTKIHDFSIFSAADPGFGYGKYGINMSSRTYSKIENVRVIRASSDFCIFADYAWNVTFENCNLYTEIGRPGSGGGSLRLDDECNAVLVNACDMQGSGQGDVGISIAGTSIDVKILGGSIQNFTRVGIESVAGTNARACSVDGVYFEGPTPNSIIIGGSVNDNWDIRNNYFHSNLVAVKVADEAITRNLKIHDNTIFSGVTAFERGAGAYLWDMVFEDNHVEVDGPAFVMDDEEPARLSMTISEGEQTIIAGVVTGPELAPSNNTDLMNKHISSWTSDGVPVLSNAPSSAYYNDTVVTISGASGAVSNKVMDITASKNGWAQDGWVTLVIPVSAFSGTATVRIFDGVTNHDLAVSPTAGKLDVRFLQARLNAGATECTVSILPNGSSMQWGTPILFTGLRAKDFRFDRTHRLQGELTWDPASLTSGFGLTSPDVPVMGADLGDLVTIAPPYDIAGMSYSGYVRTDDFVHIRIENNTGGTIDLGSGEWKAFVRKQ